MASLNYKSFRKTYGKSWAKTGEIKVDKAVLDFIGKTLVQILSQESLNEFAKRGWSVNDPMGGPSIGKSFRYKIVGESTVEVLSSFYGLAELVNGIPERKMTWLTQQAQNRTVGKGKNQRVGKRKKPLIVPMEDESGQVIFRMAPLKTADAWIHPGIAKFGFMEVAFRKARKKVAEILSEYAVNVIAGGLEK